jgi:hypothetical protein
MALPFLEAMLPRRAHAAEPAVGSPNRLLVFYVPNGFHMPAWTPTSVGSGYELPPTMASLTPYQSELLVLSGLDNVAAIDIVPGDHARGTGSFLTCMPIFETEGADILNGTSVDQRIAQAVGTATKFPSLELGSEGGKSTGVCDPEYSCAYTRNIAWSSPTTPVPKEINPREAFDRLFAGYDASLTAEQVAKRRLLKMSILDFVLEDAKALRKEVGQKDRQKLEEYMTSVYELEKQIESFDNMSECIVGPKPPPAQNIQDHVRMMLDIMVLAFQCDLTRVATYMLGNAGSSRVYGFLDIGTEHHYLSHHGNNLIKQAKLQTINTWEVEQLAYLLGKLQGVQEASGTLLDNSMVFFSSEIEDGNAHGHRNLPVILAGRGAGAISPGRHIQYAGEQPIADLYISMMNAMGVDDQTFGMNGTGPLAGLSG